MAMIRHSFYAPPEIRDGFRFRGGHPVLDFTATLLGRLKKKPRDLLETETDISRWFIAAGLAPSGLHAPASEASDLVTARTLREAFYSLAIAQIHHSMPDPAAIEFLNKLARQPSALPQIAPSGHLTFEGEIRHFLSLLAREALLLLTPSSAIKLHQCEGVGCAILFMDLSRSHDRRWCAMSACGNRAKAAQFRQRKRTKQQNIQA